MKVEIELPYEIGTELYWLNKDKIVKTKVVKYWSSDLTAKDFKLRIDMQRPNETSTIMTEMLDLTKVFLNKEDLVKYISE